jgi:hypothetical protein
MYNPAAIKQATDRGHHRRKEQETLKCFFPSGLTSFQRPRDFNFKSAYGWIPVSVPIVKARWTEEARPDPVGSDFTKEGTRKASPMTMRSSDATDGASTTGLAVDAFTATEVTDRSRGLCRAGNLRQDRAPAARPASLRLLRGLHSQATREDRK